MSLRAPRLAADKVAMTAAALVVLYLVSVPLVYLTWETFVVDGELSLAGFRGAFRSAGLSSLVTTSAVFTAGAVVVAMSLGVSLAFLTARTDLPGRHLLAGLVVIPVILPGILHTVSWIFLLSPRSGLVNRWLEVLPGEPTFDVFSLPGMILVEGLHLTPLVFLLVFAALRSIDAAGEEAALMSGARTRTVASRITLPSIAPAILGAGLLTGVRAIESFEVPALIGIPAGRWVVTSRIWNALRTFPPRLDEAGALSIALLVLVAAGAYAYGRLGGHGADYQTLRGMRTETRQLPLGRWRGVACVLVSAYVAIALVLPLVVLTWVSFQPFFATPALDDLSSMTLENYRQALDQPAATRAIRNSLLLGVGSATTVTVLTVLLAWLTVRSSVRGRWLLDAVASLPLVVPGLVLGLAVLVVYLRSPVPIYGTLWILYLAYLTKYLPYGMRYASAAFHQVGDDLDDAAAVSGASRWQTFRRIDLPLLVPGLAAGWAYMFVLSVRELSSSVLLYGPGTEVLSVLIFNQWSDGRFTQLAAMGVLMVVGFAASAAVLWRLWGRVRIAAQLHG